MNNIIQGDCIEVMDKMEESSVHAIVCDPPYFLGKDTTVDLHKLLNKEKFKTTGFMDREWDGGIVEIIESDEVPDQLL